MKLKVAILISVIRSCVLLIIGILALTQIPNLTNFPYFDKLVVSALPAWLYSWGNFDGVHYIGIAMQGYHEYDQAFFPVYPTLIRLLTFITHNYVVSGLILSFIGFLGGVFYFFAYMKELLDEKKAWWATIALIVFPTSFYFAAVYNESLYLLFTMMSLYAMKKQRPLQAGLGALLASLTRIQGAFLWILLIGIIFNTSKKKGQFLQILKKNVLVILMPIIGLAVYMTYLYYTTGNPMSFFTSLEAFGEQRSTSLVLLPQVFVRYVRIFFTADVSFQYWVAVLEFVAASLALATGMFAMISGYLKKNYEISSIGLYSSIMIVLPSLTGSFTSIPRYSLFAFSTYVLFASIKRSDVKVVLIITSILLQVLLATLFIQGNFIS